MHEYAIFGHSRSTIGRWLGVASIILTGALSSALVIMDEVTSIKAFSAVVVTPALIYFALHYCFENYGWKIPFFKIPDISGIWIANGITQNEDGSTRYDWNAEIDIEQTWEKICITLRTDKSSSASYTATLGKKPGTKGGWILHYSYINNPAPGHYHDLNTHKGYCELIFNKEMNEGNAAYFNSNGRRTFGIMSLKKELQ